ncbi:hypothetical protein VTN96DRAFT_651 [Rasamsonia emersonii]
MHPPSLAACPAVPAWMSRKDVDINDPTVPPSNPPVFQQCTRRSLNPIFCLLSQLGLIIVSVSESVCFVLSLANDSPGPVSKHPLLYNSSHLTGRVVSQSINPSIAIALLSEIFLSIFTSSCAIKLLSDTPCVAASTSNMRSTHARPTVSEAMSSKKRPC